jgi:hypothetical protein
MHGSQLAPPNKEACATMEEVHWKARVYVEK